MAISFVGASPVVTGANPTIDIPSGVQAGDFLILFVSSTTGTNTNNWVVQQNSNQASQVFTKTASSSESSFVLENGSSTTTAVILAYRGVGYVDVLNGSVTTGSSTSPTTTSVTTRFANDYVISFYSQAQGTARTWTAPASTTTRLNQTNTTSLRGVLIVDEAQASAGATTTRTATLSSAASWTAFAIALKEPQAFYIDPENGNDANAGTSFGTALKNISGATSAKGITAGDTVRLKQSPIYNTGVNATWTSVQDRGITPFSNISITSASNTTPIVCTTSLAHGYSTGDVIQLVGVSGNTASNGIWKITVTDPTTFSLDDSSGNGGYTSGGNISPIFCRTIKTASALVQPIASFAPFRTASLGTRTAWVASTNVTTTLSAAISKGGVLDLITISSSFTTGKIAYYTLPATLDLSAYQQLSLFINQTTGGTLGGLTISLCSDTTGDTAVDTFTIPSTGATSVWCPFTINKGSALGSAIRSISISRAANNGAQTFQFNSIVAVKSPTSVDALSNTSLVTKNNGTEGAYAVGGFGGSDGTIVFLDSSPTNPNLTSTGGAYYGTSETVTLHRIDPFNPFTLNGVALPANNTAPNSYCAYPNNAGQLNNHITYSGGWDSTNMSTRTGETWFTNSNGYGYGLNHGNNAGYLTIDRCNYTRCNNAVFSSGTITTRIIYQNCNYTAVANNCVDLSSNIIYPVEIKNCIVTNINSTGLRLYGGGNSFTAPAIIDGCTFSGNSGSNMVGFQTYSQPYLNITNSTFNTSSSTAIAISSGIFGNITNCSVNYFNTNGISLTAPLVGGVIDTVTLVPEPAGGTTPIICSNTGFSSQVPQGVYTTFRNVSVNAPTTAWSQGTTTMSFIIDGGSNCKFYNCSFSLSNVSYAFNTRIRDGGSTYLYSCTGFSGTPTSAADVYSPHLLNNAVYSQDEGGTIGNNKIYFVGGLATSQTAVRKTPSGYAWSIAPTSTSTVTSTYPIKLKIASIAANGSSPVTVSTWMRRTNTGLTMQLVCPAGQPYGATSDVVSSITAVADTWEEVSITFTPTQNAVFDIYVYAYGGTTFTGYVDDLTVSQ